MKAQPSYRLIGLRADGRREVLCIGIATKERAEALARNLIGPIVNETEFASIVAEPEGASPPVGRLQATSPRA